MTLKSQADDKADDCCDWQFNGKYFLVITDCFKKHYMKVTYDVIICPENLTLLTILTLSVVSVFIAIKVISLESTFL